MRSSYSTILNSFPAEHEDRFHEKVKENITVSIDAVVSASTINSDDLIKLLKHCTASFQLKNKNKAKRNKKIKVIKDQFIEYYRGNGFDRDALKLILCKLIQIVQLPQIKNGSLLQDNLLLLSQIINEEIIRSDSAYLSSMAKIKEIRKDSRLTLADTILRYIVGFNAGMGAASVIFGIAIAFAVSPVIITLSTIGSVILCGFITSYFIQSFKDTEDDIAVSLNNAQKTLELLAEKESILRVKCYRKLSRLAALANQYAENSKIKLDNKKGYIKLHADIQNTIYSNAMDNHIYQVTSQFSKETSLTAEIIDIQHQRPNSIFTKIFHSKHWGPLLNFFGSSGTIFGMTKMLLSIAGVTTLLGSPLTLLGVIAVGAVIFSFAFALKHWHFNLKAEKRDKKLADFESGPLNELKIKVENLKKFKKEIAKTLVIIEKKIEHQHIENISPEIAKRVQRSTESLSPSYSNSSMFKNPIPAPTQLFSPSTQNGLKYE